MTRKDRTVQSDGASVATAPVTFGGATIIVAQSATHQWEAAASGEWEPTTLEALATYVDEQTLLLDIGAYVGVVRGIALLRGAEVHAFEPDPVALTALHAMADGNPAFSDRLTIHDKAVGLEAGQFELSSESLGNSGSSLVRRSTQSVLVEVDGIDQVMSADYFSKCTFFKLDVEGAEHSILPRMWRRLRVPGRVMLISTHTYPFREPYARLPWILRGPLYRAVAIPRQLRLLPRLASLGTVSISDGDVWRRVGRLRLIALSLLVGEKEFLVRCT